MPAAAVRRFGLLSPRTAAALGVLVLVLAIATVTLKGFDHQLTTSGTWSGIAIVVMYAGAGLVMARRQPQNPIGWLLLVFIALYVLGAGAVEYAVLAYGLGHRGLPLAPAAVVLDTLQAPSLALFPPVILLFPDGRLALRRWRRVLWVYAVLTAYVSAVSVAQGVAAVAGHDIHLGTNGNLASSGQLGGWQANPPTWLVFSVLASIAAIGLSFVARQVLSWRRAGGERRQQLKWLACGAAMGGFLDPARGPDRLSCPSGRAGRPAVRHRRGDLEVPALCRPDRGRVRSTAQRRRRLGLGPR